MDKSTLLALLAEVQRGHTSPEMATQRLADLPFEDIGHTRIDHHRSLRTGLPEVIYAAGKTPEQVAEIFARMAAAGTAVLATRAAPEAAIAVQNAIPAAVYNAVARTITLGRPVPASGSFASCVAVLCAGTSDLPVAEEAAITAEHFGVRVTPPVRCRRRWAASAAGRARPTRRSRLHHCLRGNGGRSAVGRRRSGGAFR